MSAKAIAFDIGGVHVDWKPAHPYRRLLPDDAAVADFLGSVCTPAWNQPFDAGMPSADGIATPSALHPGKAALIAAYRDRREEMLVGEIPDAG